MSAYRMASLALVGAGVMIACAGGVTAEGPSRASRTGSGGTSSGTGGASGSGTSASTGSGGTPVFEGADGGLIASDPTTCVAQVQQGQPTPVDMYIMLDASGSMTEPVSSGTSKWEAVANAIAGFVRADASVGLGVGLQFFPLILPGTPSSCTTNAECGAAGPCELNVCAQDGAAIYCVDASDCPSGVDCVPIAGHCSLTPNYLCPRLGSNCFAPAKGKCVDFTRECVNATDCDAQDYANPAVPITTLPDGASAIVDAMVARVPSGLTPTAPALRGAIDQAKTWAEAHPDHEVVAVLATDGLPTACTPTDIPTIAFIATAGLEATPSIRTFVIGVSSPGDLDSPDNLAAIADSGGTGSPLFVDASADVTAQFLDALNSIRHTVLTCEFQIPAAPTGQMLDYSKVNLQFTEGTTTRDLGHVTTADLCAATTDGWYYDNDPSTGGTPTKIVVCPSVCTDFKASTDGVVNLEIGCATREAIIR